MNSFKAAEIICDGGSFEWTNGQCAYVRFLIRTEDFEIRETVELAGVFGRERSGDVEWMAALESINRFRCKLLGVNQGKAKGIKKYFLFVHSDYQPMIFAMCGMYGRNSNPSKKSLALFRKTQEALKPFGGSSFVWQPRKYINSILGSKPHRQINQP